MSLLQFVLLTTLLSIVAVLAIGVAGGFLNDVLLQIHKELHLL